MIYDGALADHRSIEAGEGVYAVKVQPPLEVTDEGIVLNPQDPVMGMIMRGQASNTTPVVVSSQVAADVGSSTRFSRGDHIHNHELVQTGSSFTGLTTSQAVDLSASLAWDSGTNTITLARTGMVFNRDQSGHMITGPTTPNNLTVALTGIASSHNLLDGDIHPDTLVAAVSQGSLVTGDSTPKWRELVKGNNDDVLRMSTNDVAWEAWPSASDTGTGLIATSLTWVKVHYKSLLGVAATITTEVSTDDWRPRHLMWWAKEDAGGDPQYLDTDAEQGTSDLFTYGERSGNVFGTAEIFGVGSFYMLIDDADGHLQVVCANPGQIAAEAVYCIKILHWGDVDVTGTYQDIGDGH